MFPPYSVNCPLLKSVSLHSRCTQVDILAAITDPEEKSHVFGGLPTGFGKSLYQMLVSLLSPAGVKAVLKTTPIPIFSQNSLLLCPLA